MAMMQLRGPGCSAHCSAHCSSSCSSRRAFRPVAGLAGPALVSRRTQQQRLARRLRSADPGTDPVAAAAGVDDDEDLSSEAARKKAEADRLRAAEKFMVIGSGTAACKGCGYEYSPDRGDPDFPVPKGVRFQDLPDDYVCPICGAAKERFESRVKVVAGFAENQQYGLGTNSMTEAQKSLLIYGALAVFFVLFLAGYALD